MTDRRSLVHTVSHMAHCMTTHITSITNRPSRPPRAIHLLLFLLALGFGTMVPGRTAQAATPTLVAQEPSLRAVDTVELFRNGLYWWTSSSCTETFNPGGASQIVYADPRIASSAASLYRSGAGSSGGFKPGDLFESSLVLAGTASLPKGDLLPDCGYGSYFVRDDEAFYYAKNRTLLRKSLTASSFAVGEPIRVRGRIGPEPVTADGVIFATDSELFAYVLDIPGNRLTVFRIAKKGVSSVFADICTIPGLSMKKAGVADIIATDGSYFSSELILLTMDGRLYRCPIAGTPQLVRNGVADFAFRNERYTTSGPLGIPTFRQATTLYIAMGNLIVPQGDGRLLVRDLTPGARAEFTDYNAGSGFKITSVAVDLNRIFITRTPASGLGNSDLLSRRAPARPSLTNPGDPDFATIALQREFRSLRSSGRTLYFAHGNTVQSLPSDAPPIRLDFEAFGLEVTQGIQNLNNTVELVAGRPLMVRGYARVADNTTRFSQFDVPARLRVQHIQDFLGIPVVTDVEGSPFLPDQSPSLLREVPLSQLRTNLGQTYLFQLPATLIRSGKLRFELLLNEGRAVPETGTSPLANNSTSATLEVRNVLPPVLVFARMAYGGSAFDPQAPGAQFWEIVRRAESMLPVQGFRVSMRNAIVYKPKLTFTGLKFRSFDIPDNEDAALMWLSIARTFDDNPLNSHYAGMFPPGVSGFNGLGYTPGHSLIFRMGTEAGGGAAWNAPVGGRTLAHELSHNFNFNHIASDLTCGGSVPEGPYDVLPGGASPCTMGATDLESPATSVGFDPLTWSLALPGSNGDLLSYARTRWTSDYNWMRMLTLLNLSYNAAFPAGAPAPALAGPVQLQGLEDEPVLVVSAILHPGGQSGELLPASTLPPGTLKPETLASLTSLPAEFPADYPVRLQVVDVLGEVLLDEPAPTQSLSDGASSSSLIQRALTLPGGAASLRLVNQGNVLAELPISLNAPAVTLDPIVPGGATLDLTWTATDADGDPLYTTVQYSPDDGVTWNTLAVHNPESSQSFDTSLLAGSASARIRLITTDGIHSALAVSEAFEIARHAPSVQLDGLLEGAQFDLGSTVTARGVGYDAEDGSLDTASLLWTLAGPENRTGTGPDFAASALPPGTYRLTLTGTDSDGNADSRTVQFIVRSLGIADGPEPVLDGLSADSAYAVNPRIRFGVRGSRYSTASFAHTPGALWVCLTGLPYGGSPGATASAGVRLDTTAAGTLGENAIGFAVDDQGRIYRSQGDGAALVALDSPPIGFSFELLRDGTAWSVEMRIADSLLGGWNRQLGLVLVQDDGDGNTVPETWPAGTDLGSASAWTSAQAGPLPPLTADGNLIPYGNAEGLAGGDGSTPVVMSPWTISGPLTVVQWNTPDGFPSSADAGPDDRGANFFAGGPGAASSATLHLRLPVAEEKVDAGAITYELSAWLGGFLDQEDSATLSLSFLDAAETVMETVVLGPVTAADRSGLTGLQPRSAMATVPAGARTARVVLEFSRSGGNFNDGYADNLRLVLREGSLLEPQNLPPIAVAGPDQDMVVSGGESIVLDGTASSDPEGSPITYTWSQLSGPPLTFNDGDSATPSFVAPAVQEPVTLLFQLVVFDSAWESAPSSVSVTLRPREPGMEIRILSITVDASGVATLVCSGAEGQSLQLERTADLESGAWEPIGDPLSVTGGTLTLVDPDSTSLPQAFYRFRTVGE